MTVKKSVRAIRNLQAFFAALLAVSTSPVHAEQFGVQIGPGVADHDVKKLDLGLIWDPGLQWWHFAGFHFTLVGEFHTAYWHLTETAASQPQIWEFGVTPVFRIIKDTGLIRPFFEAGVGVRLLSHVYLTPDRTMSSAFQFADMVGIGAQFGEHQNYQAGLRFQHISNADIKTPNPGLNFSWVYVQYNF
ncbi:acyloxyacyl hydrolase [Paraburkholderia tropica]|uniref:Lipid A deacylase n=1 Tax=Paraburkholderia tropica TaxID=92647 RepID=A0ABX5MCG9_9BURK|nr:acyloxyacyl hydrolase [Paraburkholderia tropica]PXX05883.1 lipid A 3-O-deacylase PagL [Paraburkholderia tropica]PZW70925.1 lipid A 3-O-deacylase PagL [Paraburkholderia tropica]